MILILTEILYTENFKLISCIGLEIRPLEMFISRTYNTFLDLQTTYSAEYRLCHSAFYRFRWSAFRILQIPAVRIPPIRVLQIPQSTDSIPFRILQIPFHSAEYRRPPWTPPVHHCATLCTEEGNIWNRRRSRIHNHPKKIQMNSTSNFH